jgi:hypothetical protein
MIGIGTKRQKRRGEVSQNNHELEAAERYYWSKIRQAIHLDDPAGIVTWTLAAVWAHPELSTRLRDRAVAEFNDGRPTMAQVITAVQEARL